MSAGGSKSAENVRVRAISIATRTCAHIQQRGLAFNEEVLLWKTIKSALFTCVRLLGVLSGSRQQTETEGNMQAKQVHWLRQGEQSLLVNRCRNKTTGASKKRDINGDIIPDDFIVDSEPLQNLELSNERCIDIAQQSTTTTSETPSAPIEGFTTGPVVLLKRIRLGRYH